jgi:sulfate adenylyltransferase subunit 2
VHIDTGHNFQEALDFRDALAEKTGEKLIVRNVGDTIREQNLAEPKGKFASRNALQTFTLCWIRSTNSNSMPVSAAHEAMKKKQGRKKEFFLCVMNLANGIPNCKDPNYGTLITEEFTKEKTCACSRSATGPNWISGIISAGKRSTCLPSISHMNAKCWNMKGQLVALSEFIQLEDTDKISTRTVRYRTVGDMTCTAAVESSASTIDDIINEIIATKTSERGETRIDDKVSEAAMEDRKKSGYF